MIVGKDTDTSMGGLGMGLQGLHLQDYGFRAAMDLN